MLQAEACSTGKVIAALDATPLTERTGGIARYTAELSRAVATAFPEDTYWLMSDQPFSPPPNPPPNLRASGGPRKRSERRWWLFGLRAELIRCGAEVFHGTDFAVPYLPRRPSVLTLHDLSPWAAEPWRAASARVRRRTPVLLRLGFATIIVTPTEAIRRAAIERFRLAPDRVTATPLAAAAHLRRSDGPPPARPYFLFAGTLDARKNLDVIVGAWREIRRQREVDLVLAGRAGSAPQTPEPGLILRSEVSDEELAELYSHASALLFPSHYEGFGLPVLEAMQCGAPVIASRDPAVMEVAGDAAALIDSGDAAAWKAAMEQALSDSAWSADMARRGMERSARFSWERTARLTREVYKEAIGRFAAHA